MQKSPAWITLIYIVLGAVWLMLGNILIEYIDLKTPDQDLSILYSYKNLIFLMVSGILLFLLIQLHHRKYRAAEQNYETLFQGSPAAIYVFEKESYRFLEVNEVMVRKYGYSAEEFLQMTALDIRTADEAEKLKQYFLTQPVEGHETGIWLHRKKDGTLFHMLISYHSSVYKNIPAYTVIAIDVEVNVVAEQKIKELLKTYETVTSVTNDVIWEYDPATDRLNWMEGFSEIFGYESGIREHTREWIMSLVHPDDKAALDASLEAAYASKSERWSHEYRFLCADGTFKHVYNQAFIFWDKDGNQEKLVGALRDITVRKNYEERLLKKNEMLKDIAWKNSHELRRPLGNVIGMVDMLKADPGSAEDPSIMEMLSKSVAELDEIVAEINQFSSRFEKE